MPMTRSGGSRYGRGPYGRARRGTDRRPQGHLHGIRSSTTPSTIDAATQAPSESHKRRAGPEQESRPQPGSQQEKAQQDRDAMLRYLVQDAGRQVVGPARPPPLGSLELAGPLRTNYTADGWDVKVACGPFVWPLHRKVLSQCQYFADRLPPPPGATETASSVLELHLHDPGQLANVLRFLYYRDYPGADYDRREPLYADSVLTNTAMCVAGASVDCTDMVAFAVKRIEAWSAAALGPAAASPLRTAVRHERIMDYALLRLADPLRRSLAIVHEQPAAARAGPLRLLRLALLRIVDVALPCLASNESFRTHFRNEWDRPTAGSTEAGGGKTLVESLVLDHAVFSSEGAIRQPPTERPPPPSPPFARLVALLQQLAETERRGMASSPGGRKRSSSSSGSSRASEGSRGRSRRDSGGDQKEEDEEQPPKGWKQTLGESMDEHERVMAELRALLRDVLGD